MPEFELETAHAPQAHNVLGKSASELARMLEDQGADVLIAMRSVLTQAPVAETERFKTLSQAPERGIDGAAAVALLRTVPHGFAPAARMQSFAPVAGSSDPGVLNLLRWWEMIFGRYVPTGQAVPPIPVYCPVFDYGAAPLIEKAVTVEVDYSATQERASTLSLSFKGIGLTGTVNETVSVSTHVPATSGRFQVSVPVQMDLVEYRDSHTGDLRYAGTVTKVHPAGHFTPADQDQFVDITPRGRQLVPVKFLSSSLPGVTVRKNIERNKGFEATVGKTLVSGLELGLEYKVTSKSEIAVTYTKTRADELHLQLWDEAEGLVRIV